MNWSARLMIIIIFCGLSCGKSTYKTVYNNLDYLLYRQIDSYCDVSDVQKTWIKEHIASQLKWHRDEALPGYKEIIRFVQDNVKNGFTDKSYDMMNQKIRLEVKRIADHVADDASDFMQTLSPQQIVHFRNELASYNEKIEERISDRKKDPQGERLRITVEMLERYYGDFSSAQKKRISEILKSYPDVPSDEVKLKYLKETQSGFIALLESHADKKVLKKYMIEWGTRDEKFIPKYFSDSIKETERINKAILFEVDKTVVTRQQREEGIADFQGLIDSIDDIRHEK